MITYKPGERCLPSDVPSCRAVAPLASEGLARISRGNTEALTSTRRCGWQAATMQQYQKTACLDGSDGRARSGSNVSRGQPGRMDAQPSSIANETQTRPEVTVIR